MECQQEPSLKAIVNSSGLSTPDGMPLVWLSRLNGFRRASRVYGPDLMLGLCERSQNTGHRHFFTGELPESLSGWPNVFNSAFRVSRLRAFMLRRFRRSVQSRVDQCSIGSTQRSPTSSGWVRVRLNRIIGSANHRPLLEAPVLIAIGAAFDFHAGVLRQAPRWMQRSGLEWLFDWPRSPDGSRTATWSSTRCSSSTRCCRRQDCGGLRAIPLDSLFQLPSERRLTTFRTTRQDHLGLKLLELPASFGRELDFGHLGSFTFVVLDG